MLLQNKHIRGFLACLLFFVFAIGIIPKKYLHDIFAKHEDSRNLVTDHSLNTIGLSGYNCNCDGQVAESNFLYCPQDVEILLPSTPSSKGTLKIFFSSLPQYYTSLRGPPVML